jgi:carbon-monoxide dehydrogenase medium subunit
MIPSGFQYHAPSTIRDAIELLKGCEDAKIIAGGHSLLPMMKLRFAEPEHLIDINSIAELKGIRDEGTHLHIGAMTTENELIDSDLVNQKCPLITAAARLIADPQVRNRGTIGGDVAHGDPGNDHPAIMMATDAEFLLVGAEGERTMPANGFFLGTYWTGLEDGEIMTGIRVPVFSPNTGYGFNKLKRKTGDFATAAAAVVLRVSSGVIDHIRITLTNVGPTALRGEEAENLLLGKSLDESLVQQAAQAVIDVCEPAEDLRGDEEYKAQMAGEMARRSLRDAWAQVGG